MIKLAKLEIVDLRSAWETEDRHFTPWLAREENLSLLGEAIGIELELEAQEKDVGPFRADILCKDTAETDHWVVIENQIERTDHKHLGQLITYASGLSAATVVWIAREFQEEHRAALDWLNRNSTDGVRFFGIVVELWKIGDSDPAPKFHVVSKPNDWESTVKSSARVPDEGFRPSQVLRMNYWTAFRDYLRAEKSVLRPQAPRPNHWYTFGIGTSEARISALLVPKNQLISVEFVLTSENAKQYFKILEENKDDIERAIGVPLQWREMPDNKQSKIVADRITRSSAEENWPEQFAWLKTTLERFSATFRQYMADL